MKHLISHRTEYRYSAAFNYAIQLLRLTPRSKSTQQVLDWHIDAPGSLSESVDAFGNKGHTLVITQPHTSLTIHAHGTVEVTALHDGQLGLIEQGNLPVLCYCVATPRTAASEAIMALADCLPKRQLASPADGLTLAERIREAVVYVSGVTDVTATADEALRLQRGVCQDHAHLFLAVARALSVPTRYVSGYLNTGGQFDPNMASHAWVDVWFAELGWVSIDVTNSQFASDGHCRLAIGRDYDSASPVRGVRQGGGNESLNVQVSVQ
jgi:transglutaminase-like putative cysteine protease